MLIKSKLERQFDELPVKSGNRISRTSAEADKARARRLRRNRRISDSSRTGPAGWSVRMW